MRITRQIQEMFDRLRGRVTALESASSSSSAPADAPYIVSSLSSGLSNESALVAGAGIAISTVGTSTTVAQNDIISYKSADQTLIGTTLADVTNTGLSLEANVTYQFEFFLLCDADATTTGIDITCNGPTTSILCYEMIYWTSATATTVRGATTYNVNNGSTGSNGTAVRGYWIRGVICPSAAGTLIARVKREAVGTGPNVRAGSYGVARRIA